MLIYVCLLDFAMLVGLFREYRLKFSGLTLENLYKSIWMISLFMGIESHTYSMSEWRLNV
jgi:hypothetical protein